MAILRTYLGCITAYWKRTSPENIHCKWYNFTEAIIDFYEFYNKITSENHPSKTQYLWRSCSVARELKERSFMWISSVNSHTWVLAGTDRQMRKKLALDQEPRTDRCRMLIVRTAWFPRQFMNGSFGPRNSCGYFSIGYRYNGYKTHIAPHH
jgi:hypothetical protein